MSFLVYILSLIFNFIIFFVNIIIMRRANSYSANYQKVTDLIKLSNNFVNISSFLVFLIFTFLAFKATKNMDKKKNKIIYFVITVVFLLLQLVVIRVLLLRPVITET